MNKIPKTHKSKVQSFLLNEWAIDPTTCILIFSLQAKLQIFVVLCTQNTTVSIYTPATKQCQGNSRVITPTPAYPRKSIIELQETIVKFLVYVKDILASFTELCTVSCQGAVGGLHEMGLWQPLNHIGCLGDQYMECHALHCLNHIVLPSRIAGDRYHDRALQWGTLL